MKKKQTKNRKIITLIIALIVVLAGGIIFVGAVSGWFSDAKVALSQDLYTENPELILLDGEKYNELINSKKSFILFVDQSRCTTADRLRNYTLDYAKEKGINIYKIMFAEIKDLSLHDYVKYYPSVVIVDHGRVRNFLKADSDEDAEEYNNYETFKAWLDHYI